METAKPSSPTRKQLLAEIRSQGLQKALSPLLENAQEIISPPVLMEIYMLPRENFPLRGFVPPSLLVKISSLIINHFP
ncbi:MAG: hypothetical protein ABIK90_07375 [candidate division WOR-3 bacterium]